MLSPGEGVGATGGGYGKLGLQGWSGVAAGDDSSGATVTGRQLLVVILRLLHVLLYSAYELTSLNFENLKHSEMKQ